MQKFEFKPIELSFEEFRFIKKRVSNGELFEHILKNEFGERLVIDSPRENQNKLLITKLYPGDNSITSGTFPDIQFNDCTLSDAGLFDVCKTMNNEKSERILFDSERTVIPLDMGHFIISYRSKDVRNSDKDAFHKAGCCRYDELMGGIQMPRLSGYFDFNTTENCYCLILLAEFKLKETYNPIAYKSIVLLPTIFNLLFTTADFYIFQGAYKFSYEKFKSTQDKNAHAMSCFSTALNDVSSIYQNGKMSDTDMLVAVLLKYVKLYNLSSFEEIEDKFGQHICKIVKDIVG